MATADDSQLLEKLEHVKCDLCEEDNTELLFQKRGILTGELFNIVRCRNDGLVYVNPRISKAGLEQLYDERYYRGEGFDPNVNYVDGITQPNARQTRVKRGMSKRIAQIATSLPSHVSPGRFLDLGCGNGQLLQFMKDRGFEVFGLDVSRAACNLARNRGLDVYCGEITDNAFSHPAGTFSIVAAVEVLEHLHAPKACLHRISSLLEPGGLFYYTTANAERIRVEGRDWPYLNPEGHLYYFSHRVMELYFAEVGLQPLCPYEYPSFFTIDATSFYEQSRNFAKLLLLRSRLLRRILLRPYLEFRNYQLMPLAKKPLE